jgi:hypothetical protein
VFVLLLILIAVLFGFGFLQPIWWVAAAVLVYGATRHGRGRGGGRSRSGGSDLGDYRDYRARRDRRERWGPSLQPPEPGALAARGPSRPRTPQVTVRWTGSHGFRDGSRQAGHVAIVKEFMPAAGAGRARGHRPGPRHADGPGPLPPWAGQDASGGCHGSATPDFRRWPRPWSPPGKASRPRSTCSGQCAVRCGDFTQKTRGATRASGQSPR